MEDEMPDERKMRMSLKHSVHQQVRYSGQSKRTEYRKIAEEANLIKNELENYLIKSKLDVTNPCCQSIQNSHILSNKSEKLNFSEQIQNISSGSYNSSNGDEDCSDNSGSGNEDSSDDTILSNDEKNTNLIDQLHIWSSKHNITNAALTDLLHILKPNNSFLPLDARTLLQTPKTVDVVKCDSGSYIYFGLEQNLIKRILDGLIPSNYPLMKQKIGLMNLSPSNFLSVSVNVDGLPIHTSSTKSFWPLLCTLDQAVNKKPFVVAIYYGDSKPACANNFLSPFIEECKKLEANGFKLNNTSFAFRISCIIADSPARSFIKCIVGHNSRNGCEKCTQEGTYLGRTVWPYKKRTELRSDALFENLIYEDHQRSKSVLSELDIGLVTQVPLDYMHLICLGIMKKLIHAWVEKGPKRCKLSAISVESISLRLSIISQNHYPKEFSRRPRPLKLFKFWKATEFRSFILYLGPVVLQNILSKELYDHFLLLHCAIYILASDFAKVEAMRNYANELLHCFVENISYYYGNEFLVYNVHNLLHIVKDVENFGCLDNFSAFPFENFMGSTLKRMLRSPNNPLQQVAKRLEEKNFCGNFPLKSEKVVIIKNGKIRSIKLPGSNCVASLSLANSCFFTKSGDIVIVKSIEDIGISNCFKLYCDFFLHKFNYFMIPLESSKLGIYGLHSLQSGKVILSTDLSKKCVLLPDFINVSKVSYICFPYCNMDIFH